MLWKWLCLVGCIASSVMAEEPYFASELIFPLHAQHNHAPGIAELSNGELFVSWYRGSGERRADDVAVFGARKPVGAKEWSEAFLLVDTPGFPDCNTCLMVDTRGRLTLFWPLILANTWESCVTQMLIADDPVGTGCPKWTRRDSLWLKPDDFSDTARKELDRLVAAVPAGAMSDKLKTEIEEVRTRLGDKLFQRLGWQPRCKPTVLPSGRILLPLYSDTFSFSLMAISDDDGQTWHASQPLIGFGAIQPSVLRRDNGTLVAYMRENGVLRKVRVSESKDDGETWGPVGTIDLPNPGSGLDAVRLQNGHWLLVYNDTIIGRNKLAVSLSTDEGRTWPHTRHLEDQPTGQFHYPAVIQTKNGRIHVVYSYFVEGGKSMKHAEFDESWIQSIQK
ncbi:MAG TPA: sialidase family protein [Planctomycetaceae bacterium]|nr:sialidase family protein [Planctomycetaceae bacterium]